MVIFARACLLLAAVATGASALSTPARQPWDLGRFAKQLFLYSPLGGTTKVGSDGEVLWPSPSLEWGPLDDVVMGGASVSTWKREADGSGLWSMDVTDANNGGFAGVRTRLLSPAIDASGYNGIQIKLEGGGKRYKFSVRDSTDWNGIGWTWIFPTSARGVTTVKLPFRDAVPTQYAKVVAGAELNAASIQALQFTYSKFEYDGGINPTFEPASFGVSIKEISLV